MDMTSIGAALSLVQAGIKSGEIIVVACQEFPDEFVTNQTTADLCESIKAYAGTHSGIIYTGAVTLSDMPFTGNAECRVWVIASTLGGYILALELVSATVQPYFWNGVYWNSFTGWVSSTIMATDDNNGNVIVSGG